jgi:uncharacterized membrane protein YoaK (UPF0700 family)
MAAHMGGACGDCEAGRLCAAALAPGCVGPAYGDDTFGGRVDSNNPQHANTHEETGLTLAVCLTMIAGYVDATAFVHFGGLFVSFMSGNSTRLAALPALGHGGAGAVAAGAVALFVMGVFAGRLVNEAAGAWRRPAVLSLTAALLGLAAISGGVAAAPASAPAVLGLSIGAMTLAMGVMNAALKRVGTAEVAATYVTGALVRLGQALADRAMGRGGQWATYLLAWLGLVLGAALGAQAAIRFGLGGLVVPAAFAALLATVCGGQVRRAQAAGRG